MWDALNHMWNRSSPKHRSQRVKKPKKPIKLETPDDFLAESFFMEDKDVPLAYLKK